MFIHGWPRTYLLILTRPQHSSNPRLTTGNYIGEHPVQGDVVVNPQSPISRALAVELLGTGSVTSAVPTGAQVGLWRVAAVRGLRRYPVDLCDCRAVRGAPQPCGVTEHGSVASCGFSGPPAAPVRCISVLWRGAGWRHGGAVFRWLYSGRADQPVRPLYASGLESSARLRPPPCGAHAGMGFGGNTRTPWRFLGIHRRPVGGRAVWRPDLAVGGRPQRLGIPLNLKQMHTASTINRTFTLS